MTEDAYRPMANKFFSAAEVAAWTGGELLDGGEEGLRMTGLATLEAAEEHEVSFVASAKAVKLAAASQAGLLLVPKGSEIAGRPRVAVDEVWGAVATLMARIYGDDEPEPQVHHTAIVGEGVELGADVSIGAYSVIGDGARIGDGSVLGAHTIVASDCRIGADCRLTARVTLIGRVFLGDRVLIHPGAVLGADGFKFEVVGGRALKIPQIGAVVVEDDVEIGANTTIDRAFLNETRIGRGTKIDNQCQIAHNVQIGPGCLMAAQVGIAGSTKLGAGCLVGGNAGLADNISIGAGAVIAAAAKVHGNHKDGAMLSGHPAIEMREFAKVAASLNRLPELLKRVRALEKSGAAE